MAKKIKLKDLKLDTCVTSLEKKEQERAKGGFIYIPGNTTGVNGGKEGWTGLKTRIVVQAELSKSS